METIETILGYKFRNSLLLAEALTHPSLAYEAKRPTFDNQRLEFLGDAVIQLVLTEHIYSMFPEEKEGELTKFRARLVSKGALCKFAENISLGKYVMLGKGEESSGGRTRPSTLADAFEALLGAIYLDSGFDAAKEVILRITADGIIKISEQPDEKNPKGQLQEILQAIIPESPVYSVKNESGPDHSKKFEVSVEWRGEKLAEGTGANKKEAEAQAARNALNEKAWMQTNFEKKGADL